MTKTHCMKIAYILGPNIAISGDSNGIKSQARSWRNGLVQLGHHVDAINTWENYSWKEYDIIHIFGRGLWLPSFLVRLKNFNPNIVISPIIDSIQNPFKYKLSSYVGMQKFRLYSPTYAFKKSLPYLRAVFVRSEYELKYISDSLSCKKEIIHKVPLSYSVTTNSEKVNQQKENFCLHVSSIYQPRKNVIRLIKAAKKYNFKLVLAGSKGVENDFKPLKNEIGNAVNIEVLGFVPQKILIDLYKRAKVFALPSTSEGVGIVALDAAVYGCEIVMTNVGGPKEYYNNMAHLVNPYKIDEIGQSILKALNEKPLQPDLKNHIYKNYSSDKIIKALEKSYQQITQLSEIKE